MLNKKGSAILETTIVLPLVIMVLIFLINLNILLFSMVMEKTKIEREAQTISSYNSKSFYSRRSSEEIKKNNWLIENEGVQLYKNVIVASKVEYESVIFRNLQFSKYIEAESTIFDEASFIRNSQLLKESMSTILKDR